MIFSNRHIPVLMYHRVHESETDFLTVSVAQLKKQFNYLKTHNYTTISVEQLINYQKRKEKLPSRSVLITFDDAHVSFQSLALPMLNKFNFKATVFLPTNLLGTTHIDCGEILTTQALQKIQKENFNIEYALHTHNHLNIAKLSASEIENEISENISFLKKNQLHFTPSLAYPYGARPKTEIEKNKLKSIFKNCDIESAFRIGNRLNPREIKELFDINRLDIRGNDLYLSFLFKIKFGKLF